MASGKRDLKIVPRAQVQPPTISGRWLLVAVFTTLIAAAICAWGTMCLLFWQGSWQLLYHPKSALTGTPAAVGVPFDAIGFAATESGELRLHGWWIPAASGARFANVTVLYLHGATGDLSDSVDALARLHASGVTVFAFDYRGYGQSEFAHPSEAHWTQDADWAIGYLTGTRQIAPHNILLVGSGVGADLAAEVAAAHPDLGGVVLDAPIPNAADVIFNDPRARLVPAHLLLRDRWNLDAAASSVRVPSLWIIPRSDQQSMSAYNRTPSPKAIIRTPASGPAFSSAFTAWLANLR